VIPGIVLAIGFYVRLHAAAARATNGTAWILILAFATRFLPIAYANSDAAIRAINPELEDAVRILGGSRALRAAPRGDAPATARPGGRVHPRVHPATRELSSAIVLYTRAPRCCRADLDQEDRGQLRDPRSFELVLRHRHTVALVMIGFTDRRRERQLARGRDEHEDERARQAAL